MQRFQGSVFIVVLFFVALVAAALIAPPPAASGPAVSGTVAAQQSGSWVVGISGTPSVNVTTLPAVSVAGTPTVNIASMPAVSLAGTPSVSVDNLAPVKIDLSGNTVTVGNTPASPVPVRDVDGRAPARFGSTYVDSNSTSNYPPVIPEVPAGKMFVITSINISGFTPNPFPHLTDGACTLELVAGNVGSFITRVALRADFQGFVTANVQTYVPLNSGERVGVGCAGEPFNANSLFGITMSGYFVPAQ